MKIAIIGGGAAGLMAAAAICERGSANQVLLVEKNDAVGKKVLITGGGRCNVTTGLRDIRQVLLKYPRGSKFLNSAMRQFSPEMVYAWFESHGVPLKIEEDMRVFPKSDDGRDIVGVFERLFAQAGVSLLLNSSVERVEKSDGGFRVAVKGGPVLEVDRVILTTGGQAYRQTGSTGDGYGWAESLGHKITPLAPSLSAFYTREKWPQDISGLSFSKARLRANLDGDPEFTGPFLFTHRGLTGPAVFALSSLTAFERYDSSHPMEIRVDLYPDTSADEMLEKLDSAMHANGKKSVVNVLDFFMSKSLAAVLCQELKIVPVASAGNMSKKQLGRMVDWLKNLPLHVVGRDAGEEFVTAGGVDLNDVDQRTMESKITPGLFFAGEILAIDGFTGGFNLQSAWATGRAAGIGACR